MIHELKTWPEFFDAVKRGEKTFEVRRDDRGFQVGDTLRLVRWQPAKGYAGGGFETDQDGKPWWHGKDGRRAEIEAVVTYKLAGGRFGIDPDWCVLGFDIPMEVHP